MSSLDDLTNLYGIPIIYLLFFSNQKQKFKDLPYPLHYGFLKACADPGAITPIGVSGIYSLFNFFELLCIYFLIVQNS